MIVVPMIMMQALPYINANCLLTREAEADFIPRGKKQIFCPIILRHTHIPLSPPIEAQRLTILYYIQHLIKDRHISGPTRVQVQWLFFFTYCMKVSSKFKPRMKRSESPNTGHELVHVPQSPLPLKMCTKTIKLG